MHVGHDLSGPDCSWVEFDPTNNQFVGDEYTVARGRDYADVAPIKGASINWQSSCTSCRQFIFENFWINY